MSHPIWLSNKGKTRSRTWGKAATGQVARQGTVTETEHWDDRVDVTVSPGPISMKVQSAPKPSDLLALFEYEQAVAEWKLAKSSGDERWRRRAHHRLEQARERVTTGPADGTGTTNQRR